MREPLVFSFAVAGSQPRRTSMNAINRLSEIESTDSWRRPGPDGFPKTSRRRKVFFLLDSLDTGGTESQAVALAIRLSRTRYDLTLGCLRARGPLLAEVHAASIPVVEFSPQGGIDSIRGLCQ
jgi:hypothetical protein